MNVVIDTDLLSALILVGIICFATMPPGSILRPSKRIQPYYLASAPLPHIFLTSIYLVTLPTFHRIEPKYSAKIAVRNGFERYQYSTLELKCGDLNEPYHTYCVLYCIGDRLYRLPTGMSASSLHH